MPSLLLAQAIERPTGEVVGLGLGIVFAGLILLIFCILLMSWILKLVVKDNPAAAAAQPQAAPAPVEASIPNRPELVAAVSAAIAEDLGTDISKIEIKSIKKL